MTYDYDLLVIGSGPAGHNAAVEAAKLGKRVAVADRNFDLGGVCLHTGTIPSKTLREAALYLSGFRQRNLAITIRLQCAVDDLSQMVRLDEFPIRIRCGGKAGRDTDALRLKIADHLTERGILAADARYVVTVQLLEPDHRRRCEQRAYGCLTFAHCRAPFCVGTSVATPSAFTTGKSPKRLRRTTCIGCRWQWNVRNELAQAVQANPIDFSATKRKHRRPLPAIAYADLPDAEPGKIFQ